MWHAKSMQWLSGNSFVSSGRVLLAAVVFVTACGAVGEGPLGADGVVAPAAGDWQENHSRSKQDVGGAPVSDVQWQTALEREDENRHEAQRELCEAFCHNQAACQGGASPRCAAMCEAYLEADPGVEGRLGCMAQASCQEVGACEGEPMGVRDDSCQFAKNGLCEEPAICRPGTDATDCTRAEPGPATCKSMCARLGDCVGFADERVIDGCEERCPVAMYAGAFSVADVACVSGAEVCADVRACTGSVALCQDTCEALVACGSFQVMADCQVWCGGQLLTGARRPEEVDCMGHSARDGFCRPEHLRACIR